MINTGEKAIFIKNTNTPVNDTTKANEQIMTAAKLNCYEKNLCSRTKSDTKYFFCNCYGTLHLVHK